MTGSLLGSQRTQRLTGTESGLAAYYPFEQMSRDAQTGIISSVGSATDVTGSGMEAQISTLNSQLSTFNFYYILSGTSIPRSAMPFLRILATLRAITRRTAFFCSSSSLRML